MKILLVDDPAQRIAMARLLRRAGADVTTADDGSDGLRLLLQKSYDVLLTDLHMPHGPDGFELIAHAGRLPLDRRPRRVIAVSGEYDRNVLRDVLERPAGVDYFAKPVDLEQLLDTIGGPSN